MNKVITIGRQFGSGGHEVGFRLAKRLNIPFYDAQLLTITAENSRFAESFLEKVDEKKPGFLSFSASGVSTGSALAATGESSLSHFYNLSQNDQVFVETGKTMKLLSEKGPCVIVGRCADYVLKDIDPINFFICADFDDRVERKLALEEKKTREEVEKEINAMDKNRAKYYEYYTHERWGDAKRYHLCINTSTVGVEKAVDILESFVNEYGKKSILPD